MGQVFFVDAEDIPVNARDWWGASLRNAPGMNSEPPTGNPDQCDTYKIPKFIDNTVIYPYRDFLLHDVGRGDCIPQALSAPGPAHK